MPPKVAASTLILLREMPDGRPQTLMIQRGKDLSFAGGNMVFPGGKVEADDHVVAARPDLLTEGPELDPEDLLGRIIAIRETWEEIGLAPGVIGVNAVEQLQHIRAELDAGRAFSEILSENGLRIDPHALVPFARWIPPVNKHTNFDTRFYIAEAPILGEASADGNETSRCCWMTGEEHVAGGNMIFPTMRNVERFAQIENMAHAISFCATYPIRIVTPWFEEREGVNWLCIPDDLGYPVTSAIFRPGIRGLPLPPEPSSADMTREPG